MKPEPLILAFDTSVAHCAAALLSGDRILAERVEPMQKGQAERLFPLLEQVLKDGEANWSDLTAIGVGTGPGNFTGIRISVSAARGLALSLGIPAIGVSSLEAQAYGTDGVVVSSLDARRGAIYVQIFGDLSGSSPVLCDLGNLPPIPARVEPTCIGHTAREIANLCAGKVSFPAMDIAPAIATIASKRLGNATLPRPAPLYIRAPDADPPRGPAPTILP